MTSHQKFNADDITVRMSLQVFEKKNIFVYFALLDQRILAVYCTNIDEYCLKQSAISRKSLKMPKVSSEAINRRKTCIRMGKTTNNGRRKTAQKTKVRVT